MNDYVIDIQNLSKYYGKTRGIESINLKVNQGEIFGFIGPNGAGKSTTIRILLNLLFPSGGSATILGMNVAYESKKIKNYIGYIPSDANFYDLMTVEEFLNYCIRFYRVNHANGRIDELCNLFELDRKRKLSDLSMGNKKKVAIIQSVIHNPKILILDEPTTGLDPLIQAKFFELLREENKRGTTIFFSSHILSEVQSICKRVAIIKAGKIVKVEDIDTLRKKQLKKVVIRAKNISVEDLHLKGIETILTNSEQRLAFTFSGAIDDLINRLANLKVDDLLIEEPDLEEIFMHYYQ